MKVLLLTTVLFLAVSCGGEVCLHGDTIHQQQLLIEELRRENETLKIAGRQWNYCPYYAPAVCQEDKQLAGCQALKQYLSDSSVSLTLAQWKFCEKYESK